MGAGMGDELRRSGQWCAGCAWGARAIPDRRRLLGIGQASGFLRLREMGYACGQARSAGQGACA